MTALYKISQVAEMLGISEATLRDWCYRNEFPYLRLGRGSKGTLRFSQSMIDEYIASRLVAPGDLPALPHRIIGGRPGRKSGQRARASTISRFSEFCKGSAEAAE